MLTLYDDECKRERRIKEEKVYKQKRRKMLRTIKVLNCILVVLISYVALKC